MTSIESFEKYWRSLPWWIRLISHKGAHAASYECGYTAGYKDGAGLQYGRVR